LTDSFKNSESFQNETLLL